MTKSCPTCKQNKLFTEFYPKPRKVMYEDSLAGFSHICKECTKIARAKYVTNNPDKCKNSDRLYHLRKAYGLDAAQYNELFELQKGSCAGCGRHQSQFNRRLVVDHCHKTGKIRGLLCIPCNLTLGYVRDDGKVLQRLISYLTQNTTESAVYSDVAENSAKKVGYVHS